MQWRERSTRLPAVSLLLHALPGVAPLPATRVQHAGACRSVQRLHRTHHPDQPMRGRGGATAPSGRLDSEGGGRRRRASRPRFGGRIRKGSEHWGARARRRARGRGSFSAAVPQPSSSANRPRRWLFCAPGRVCADRQQHRDIRRPCPLGGGPAHRTRAWWARASARQGGSGSGGWGFRTGSPLEEAATATPRRPVPTPPLLLRLRLEQKQKPHPRPPRSSRRQLSSVCFCSRSRSKSQSIV